MDYVEAIKSNRTQAGLGLMRIAELQAIAKVADWMKAEVYVSMGCGTGFDFLSLRENYRAIPALGFDCVDINPDNIYPSVEFHKQFIFEPDFGKFKPDVHEKIKAFLAKNPGRTLFYTDNGRKLEEMRQLIGYMKSGDVIGTHDYGLEGLTAVGTYIEVHEKDCQFLYAADLKLFTPIEDWITAEKCIQRFWVKP